MLSSLSKRHWLWYSSGVDQQNNEMQVFNLPFEGVWTMDNAPIDNQKYEQTEQM